MEAAGLAGKLVLVALGAGLIYAGMRLVTLAFRLWRLGLAARGIITALIAALYTFSPVDGVPDVIVGVGWIDDLIVLGMAGLYIWRLFGQRRAMRQPGGGAGPRRQGPTVIPQLPRPR